MAVTASLAIRTAQAVAELNAIGNNATLTLYSGARPATVDTAPAANTSLVVATWSGAAGTAANGVITFTPPPAAIAAVTNNSANAVWARIASSSGTACFDYDVSATGAVPPGDLQLPTVTIVSGVQVLVNSLTQTEN